MRRVRGTRWHAQPEAKRRQRRIHANTFDARSVDVAISRARIGAAVYTDSRANLTDALGIRDSAQVGAIDDAVWCRT